MAAVPPAGPPPAGAARLTGAWLHAHEPAAGAAVSARPSAREGPGEAVAGLLASLALFTSLIGVAYRPVRLIPFAVAAGLVAAAMGGRHARLAAFAIAVGALCFVVGMAVAVITKNPIY